MGRPYALASNPRTIPGAPSDALHARVVEQGHSLEIMREAEEIAGRTGRVVAFEYRGELVVVRPKR